MSKEREAFENHLKKMGKTDNETFSNNEDDSYQMDIIHFGWKIWQAAKAQAVPEGLKKFCNEHKDPAWRGRLTEYDKGYSDCCIAVLEMIESQHPSSTSGCPDEP